MNGVLVIGAGLAGLRVAEALRAGGYDGSLTLVGEEPVSPYERPALSKELLAGTKSAEELHLRTPERLAELGIDLRLGVRVDRVDPAARTATVAGEELGWEHLVLATGARPRRLRHVPGALVLRTLDDALALRPLLGPGVALTVIGAGLVGAEVASTALQLGCEVTIVDPLGGPFVNVLGPAASELLAEQWRRSGASLRFGRAVTSATDREVVLDDGARIRSDVVLVAIGVEAAGDLLGASGPVATDACGRTELDGVYACGDVALFDGRATGHWTAAGAQAAAVASAILGEPVPYDDPGYFWSDQFGLRLQIVGDPAGAAATELDGREESFAMRYRDPEGRTVAVLLANRPTEVGAARRELAAAA